MPAHAQSDGCMLVRAWYSDIPGPAGKKRADKLDPDSRATPARTFMKRKR